MGAFLIRPIPKDERVCKEYIGEREEDGIEEMRIKRGRERRERGKRVSLTQSIVRDVECLQEREISDRRREGSQSVD